MRLAYVLDRFPVLSETFIAREIEGLAHEGIRPELFALRRGEEAAEGAADGAADFRQALGAKEKENHQEDDQQFGKAEL